MMSPSWWSSGKLRDNWLCAFDCGRSRVRKLRLVQRAKAVRRTQLRPTLRCVPTASLIFPAELHGVGDARRFLLSTLAQWRVEHYEFGAPLVLTELATNAALHAGTPYEVRISLEQSHLLVEVADGSARLPRARGYGVDASTGRGITLVDAFCNDWGATPSDRGKVVWARVRPDDQSIPGPHVDDVDHDADHDTDRAPGPPAQRSAGSEQDDMSARVCAA